MKIGKTYRWEMGHRLPNHPGGCRNIHGHSYVLHVEIEGEPGHDGMILDFDEISRVVRPLINSLDHAFLCEESDTDVRRFLEDQDLKRVLVGFPSTVENITRMLGDPIQAAMAQHPTVDAVTLRIHETASSFAELRLEMKPT